MTADDRAAELRYTLPGRPISWQRDNVIKGRYVKDSKTRTGMALHRVAASNALRFPVGPRGPDATGEYAVDVAAYYNNRVHGDADRVLTLVFDALQEVTYMSDRQVKRASVEILTDPKQPRTEVVCRRLEMPVSASDYVPRAMLAALEQEDALLIEHIAISEGCTGREAAERLLSRKRAARGVRER